MAVAKIIEITATSEKSFEDAIEQGVQKADESLHNIKGAWVDGQEVLVDAGKVTGYKVRLKVTFVLD
ncbi:MAG: dodecin family protein [Gaiellales bacterium]